MLGARPLLAQAGDARSSLAPRSITHSASVRPLAKVTKLSVAAPDVAAARREDALREQALRAPADPAQQQGRRGVKGIARRFALAQPLAVDVIAAATWDAQPDGSRVGRLRVGAPGALSINLTFDRFELGPGARMWLFSPDGSLVQGPFGAGDARESGQLWSPIVLGSEVVIEILLPAGIEARVSLGTVNYGYREFGEPPEKQAGCHIDVICPEGNPYRDQIRSVGRFTLGGVLLCTGTMVANTFGDFRPYFLTADHCGIDDLNDESMVVYWNYQSPTCGALSGGRLTDNQAGARLRASWEPSDFTLVELDRVPNGAWDVYYAGWDATGAVPQKVVAIHHPGLDEKALTFDNDPLVTTEFGNGPTHWQVNRWDLGSTEGGSSGSCIFDQTSKRCVGTLTGGFASCSGENGDEDYFGKFSRHWQGGNTDATRLSTWLDPVGRFAGTPALAKLDGKDPDDCIRDDITACLLNDRFQVRIQWRDFAGQQGAGRPTLIQGSDNSVLFWFFDVQNIEVLVKVLDGCALNQRYWVFGAASTNVEYTIEVTDKRRQVVKTYTNALGNAAAALTDTSAFDTCS
jgi:lysyl endopeptidase